MGEAHNGNGGGETHLIVLVHGLFGNPRHMRSMEQSIEAMLRQHSIEGVRLHRAACMTAVGTFDGVKENGELLYKEITQKIEELGAKKLSVVGYSMGGLVARYAVGRLQERQRLFARVQPVLFATFATPHLGSRNVTGSYFGYLFNLVGPCVSGKSGLDLFRKSAIVDELADPEKPYLRALSRFEHLYMFANASSDRTVPFWTAFVAASNPFAARVDLKTYEKYPFVVDLHSTTVTAAANNEGGGGGGANCSSVSGGQMLFAAVLPLLLTVLLIALVGISLTSWVKRALNWRHHGNKASEKFVADVGDALNETLQAESPEKTGSSSGSSSNNNDNDKTGSKTAVKSGEPLPVTFAGAVGILRNAPSLKLSQAEARNIHALNQLPWNKYAVWLRTLNAHGEIVDRRQHQGDGKRLLDFFANNVVASALDSKFK